MIKKDRDCLRVWVNSLCLTSKVIEVKEQFEFHGFWLMRSENTSLSMNELQQQHLMIDESVRLCAKMPFPAGC